MSEPHSEPANDHVSDEWSYTQPIEILNWAWDAYTEASMEPAPHGAPTVVTLLLDMNVPPPVLSRLFDIAITAYREHTELT